MGSFVAGEIVVQNFKEVHTALPNPSRQVHIYPGNRESRGGIVALGAPSHCHCCVFYLVQPHPFDSRSETVPVAFRLPAIFFCQTPNSFFPRACAGGSSSTKITKQRTTLRCELVDKRRRCYSQQSSRVLSQHIDAAPPLLRLRRDLHNVNAFL